MPEPVIKNAAATAIVLFVLGQVAALTSFYGWWSPSGDELLLWADVAGTLVAVVLVVQAWFVRQRVTPYPLTPTILATVEPVTLMAVEVDDLEQHETLDPPAGMLHHIDPVPPDPTD